MKERAYFDDNDRRIITKYSRMSHSDTGLILKKINESRRTDGKPLFKIKSLIEEIRRGGGEDKTAEGYNADKAKKKYRLGKNKHLPFFDDRSRIVLEYFLGYCKYTPEVAFSQYRLLCKRGQCDIIKLYSVIDVEFLIRHHIVSPRIDHRTINKINLERVNKNIDANDKLKIIEEYLRSKPLEGKYVIYGEEPLGYKSIDEATGIPVVKPDVREEHKIEAESEKPIIETKTEEIVEDGNDVVSLSIPQNITLKIINTASKVEYQLLRKDNNIIILL